MAEIATYTMIKTKTSYGSTGTECPPKKIIKTISSYISIANESSYGDNEAVKLEDISASAYTFTVDGGTSSSAVFTSYGGSSTSFAFVSTVTTNGTTTNIAYTLTSTLPSWLTWDSVNRQFTATANVGAERTTTATFTQTNSNKMVSITVIQGAKEYIDWRFNIAQETVVNDTIGSDGGTLTYYVTSTKDGLDHGFRLTTSSGFMTPTQTGSGSQNITVTVSANTSSTSRTDFIEYRQYDSENTIRINITQSGKPADQYVLQFTDGTTTTKSGTIPAKYSSNVNLISGGVESYKITSSGQEAVSYTYTKPSWITSIEIDSDMVLVTGFSENTSTSSRSGSIVITQSGSNNTLTINVTQSGKAADAYVFTVDGSTSTTKTISASGSNVTVSVVSTKNSTTQDWSITNISADWLTAIKENSNVKLTASSNYTSTNRTGIITLTQAGSSKTATITVNQQVSNEWTYTFEPVESSKNKPTKVTTGRSDFGLDTTYTMYSYKQRSLNGVIVDETQVGVNVEYVVEYPSEHDCTIGSISADKTKWMIVLQLPTSLTTTYGTFTATQVDSNKVFKIDFMQVGDNDYRVGTYKLQKTSSSDTLWNGTDLIVYKEGSSDKTKGSQLFLSYVEINIDSDKIIEQGYTLVNRTGNASADRYIGRYSCPYRLRQSSTWFVSRFESEDPYGRLYFIFPENTGTSRSATVAMDQYIPSVEITGCEVYKNSPQIFSFTVTQHAAT